MQISRRHFIIVAASLASASVLQTESRAASPEVSESDPTAQALGYKSDGATVDTAKYPKYQAGQACANCQFYQGKSGETSGPCTVFAGKPVSAKGWCSAYVKKA
ncbi:high-potential iron-sulfur protein [Paraburkholderia sp. J8-2]|uniref:high-potential iron-sulfur protein n=1 Tax=Paraburkholderia sp. J8-2 TaxID=2805440 RepID=UPI002AB6D054|nr:high-potential iron-sulfur protein [Paraburkholderia sp. J8-2]